MSFHVSAGHLYVFLGEVSVQSLCPFSNWIVCLVLTCMSSFLDISPLSELLFVNVFSHSVSYFFVLSLVSFAVQKLFSLIELEWLLSTTEVLASVGEVVEKREPSLTAGGNVNWYSPVSYTHLTLPTIRA